MSAEAPLTPDPALEKLARFSPAPAAIDRDELLFQAGRASARAGNGWKTVAALLLVTQTATLGMLLTNPGRTTTGSRTDMVLVPGPSSESPNPVAARSPEPSDRFSYAALQKWDLDTMPTPAPAVPSGSNGPVLSVSDGNLLRLLD
jgi:hypothetical protein